VTKYSALVALAAMVAGGMSARADEGGALFTQNCLMCHQSGGMGLAGQFPRLAGRVAIIGGTPAGRAYLIDVLTYGMSGTITVDGQPLFGLMPPFAHLPNEVIASILSYVQGLGEPPARVPAAFTADEVQAGRARQPKSAADVQSERQSLQRAKIIE
jgi:mono/diheme cytochrome c family protein